jgi:hypothetical protein
MAATAPALPARGVIALRPEGAPEHHAMTPRGPALALQLPDGRRLLMLRPGRPPPPGPILTFVLIALAIGVGAYPVVRRLTRRLERLQAGVTEWGGGNLSTRVRYRTREVASWRRRSTTPPRCRTTGRCARPAGERVP